MWKMCDVGCKEMRVLHVEDVNLRALRLPFGVRANMQLGHQYHHAFRGCIASCLNKPLNHFLVLLMVAEITIVCEFQLARSIAKNCRLYRHY
jgi:hypothetical protein